MAAQNRDELQTQIDSTFVATLQIADHRAYLKDPQTESLVFRKDVIASQSPSGGSIAIDYSNKDLATVTTTGNLAVSFTGLENGDVKYLRIQKNAGNTVSFTGAVDISPRRGYINSTVTVVFYRVTNKNNEIFVCAENIDFDFQSELSNQQLVSIPIGDWNMDTSTTRQVSYSIPSGRRLAISDVIIRRDIDGIGDYSLLHHRSTDGLDTQGGISIITPTYINIFRVLGGWFDSSNFSATSYNRGWIVGSLIEG